ncbi:MAG: UDP-N-acetylmuramoyl-tripeptide--D-alanyl-D-alanine ligase [Desulfovibrio sp.]|jgi:UDP-N-acetylmuramoyl-tripeptide--D-alanyl-D-alanine ligase|nr:UDP-N-acetylmuramoyl-tripeptide--D-alanyl-D-alanine ligase [Desulfovibrio sp.]
MKLTLRDAILCLNGSVYSGPEADRMINAVRTDSRAVATGDLFFCLKGERFDAHDFAADVARAGAIAIVANRELPGIACPVILVEDTEKALGWLARDWRDRFAKNGGTVVAVTGTAGKTTVKELLAQTLASVFPVAKNHKNFNNQVGLPLSILAATGEERAWVMEAGISKPHDMAELGEIIAPDLALVLNIGPAHLEGLGDISGVARAKASLLKHLKHGGMGLCSMDYPELWAEARAILPGVHGFSARDSFAKFYARFEEALPGGRGLFEIIVDGQAFWAELPACGAHFAENAAAVAGACHLLGLTTEQMTAGLSAAALPDQRFCCVEAGGWRVLDDTYNANPLSMRRSIEAARLMAGEGALVLVLGDMKELGAGAALAHRELGAVIADAKPEAVFFQGEFAAEVAAGSGLAVTAVTGPDQVLEALRGLSGGVALVKGSRSCRMEVYAKALNEELSKTGGGCA